MLVPEPGVLQELARDERISRLDGMETIRTLVQENYSEAWRKLGTYEGDLYGVWFKAANKSMVLYNARMFEQAGVTPPTDLAGLVGTAERLASKGITPFAVAGAESAGWTLTDWFENIYQQEAGPVMYDRLASHEISWTDPSVASALRTMADILRPEWIAGGISGALNTTYEQSVQKVFGNMDHPEAAMLLGAEYVTNELSVTPEELADVRFFPFPSKMGQRAIVAGDDQVRPGGGGGDVAVLMTDRPESRRLLEFLASKEAPRPWAATGGFLTPNRNVEADVAVYPNADLRLAAKELTEATTVQFDLSDVQSAKFGSTPGEGMWQIFRQFLRDVPAVRKQPQLADKTAQALERAFCKSTPPPHARPCRR